MNLSLAENWPLGGKVVGRGVQSDATWFWDCRPYHRLVVTALAERPLLPLWGSWPSSRWAALPFSVIQPLAG